MQLFQGYDEEEGRLRGLTRPLLAGLLLFGLAGAGFWAGHLGATSSSRAPSTVSGSANVRWPGATRTQSSVPVGYSRSLAGATAAATNYGTLLSGPLLFDLPNLRAAERVVYAPSSRDRLMTEVERGLASWNNETQILTNVEKGVPLGIKSIPVAYRVESYSDDRTAIQIWRLWVVGLQGAMMATESWSTTAFMLQWQQDWKVMDLQSTPGPTPLLGQQPLQGNDLPDQLRGWQEYRHAG
jgi:hypothetical protein